MSDDTLSVTLPRYALDELEKLARSRKRALLSLANSPLPGQRRHAEKRRGEAANWAIVESLVIEALKAPDGAQ